MDEMMIKAAAEALRALALIARSLDDCSLAEAAELAFEGNGIVGLDLVGNRLLEVARIAQQVEDDLAAEAADDAPASLTIRTDLDALRAQGATVCSPDVSHQIPARPACDHGCFVIGCDACLQREEARHG